MEIPRKTKQGTWLLEQTSPNVQRSPLVSLATGFLILKLPKFAFPHPGKSSDLFCPSALGIFLDVIGPNNYHENLGWRLL
jgi:hypothetical protein